MRFIVNHVLLRIRNFCCWWRVCVFDNFLFRGVPTFPFICFSFCFIAHDLRTGRRNSWHDAGSSFFQVWLKPHPWQHTRQQNTQYARRKTQNCQNPFNPASQVVISSYFVNFMLRLSLLQHRSCNPQPIPVTNTLPPS